MSDRCLSCGQSRSAGELLLVRPLDPRVASFVVCRPTITRNFCHELAGPRSRTTLELVDVDAAREYDLARAALNTQGPS